MSEDHYLHPPVVTKEIFGNFTVIRPIVLEEINEQYVSWLNDPEVNRFLEVSGAISTNKDCYNNVNENRKKGGEVFAILTKRKKRFIGTIGLTKYSPRKKGYASFGIMIGDKKDHGSGYGGEAFLLMVDFLFKNEKIVKIRQKVIDENKKFFKSIENLGFKRMSAIEGAIQLASGRFNASILEMQRDEWINTYKDRFNKLLRNVVTRDL